MEMYSELPEKYNDFLIMSKKLLVLPVGGTLQIQFSNANNYMWRYDELLAIMVRQPNEDKESAEVHEARIMLLDKRIRRMAFTLEPLAFENGRVVQEKDFSKSTLVDIIKNHSEMAKTFEQYTGILLKEVFDLADFYS